MKDFLYLNMDFLETFMAQKNGGLEVLRAIDDTRLESTTAGTETITQEAKIEGKLNAIMAKLNGIGSVSVQSPSVFETDTSIIRNVLLMKQRESMFDSFLDHYELLNKPYAEKTDEYSLGKYVGLKTYFDFVSLSRLEALTTSELYDFYFNKEKLFSINEIQEIRQCISHLKTLFPFDSFLTAEGAIVLMEEKHLRVANSQIGYKFNSTDISVVGKVYRNVGKVREKSAPINQTLDKIQILTFSLLRTIGVLRESDSDIYLITPIAIYS